MKMCTLRFLSYLLTKMRTGQRGSAYHGINMDIKSSDILVTIDYQSINQSRKP